MGYRGDSTTGFQSPAQDFIEGVVDLPALLDLRRPGRYPVMRGRGGSRDTLIRNGAGLGHGISYGRANGGERFGTGPSNLLQQSAE